MQDNSVLAVALLLSVLTVGGEITALLRPVERTQRGGVCKVDYRANCSKNETEKIR